MKLRSKVGFTLIELLVVVLIIGILAAVALPQYQKAVEKTRITEAVTLLSSILSAQRAYLLSHDSCTSNLTELDINVPSSTTNFSLIKTYDEDSTSCVASAYPRYGKEYTLSFVLNKRTGKIERYCTETTSDGLTRQDCKVARQLDGWKLSDYSGDRPNVWDIEEEPLG